MAGLVPAIHVFSVLLHVMKTWMPGTRPGMTSVVEIRPLATLSRRWGDVRAPLMGVIVMAGIVVRGVA